MSTLSSKAVGRSDIGQTLFATANLSRTLSKSLEILVLFPPAAPSSGEGIEILDMAPSVPGRAWLSSTKASFESSPWPRAWRAHVRRMMMMMTKVRMAPRRCEERILSECVCCPPVFKGRAALYCCLIEVSGSCQEEFGAQFLTVCSACTSSCEGKCSVRITVVG